MDEVSTLRTEIKSWERNFRATHGKDASIQDIKEEPGLVQTVQEIVQRGRGGAAEEALKSSIDAPRSQSRDAAHPSLLLSRPRAIAAAQPLSGYNPFSPQKNKGKQKELSPDTRSPKTNPFRITRDPSPGPVPRLSFPSTSATTNDPFAPTPNNPVSRARKRLRGEPVSPSPNKEKRRRMVSPLDGSDEDEDLDAANTSFVDDSPAKPPAGVRSFKLLFDETSVKPKFPLQRSKTLFGEKALLPGKHESMDLDDGPLKPVKTPSTGNTSIGTDDPFFEASHKANTSSSDNETTDDRAVQKPRAPTRSLLAPSPPPANQRSSGKPHPLNGKGRAAGVAQKTAASDDEDNDRSDEDVEMDGSGPRHKVRLFDRIASRGRPRDDNGIDEDAYHIMSRRPPDTDTSQPQSSETISLPDTLLSVLSLAPTSTRRHQDEHVVEELLYGGEIWGERDEFALSDSGRGGTRDAYDDEDDWEGEGVPWEVGEL
ncbi:hypothetical protein B0H17DRAFT_1081136 [Mycena rosella]|uniref:DNA replication regulator SLD2 n=1 Tax=Mycena rosella TaxID=1033263 RepID=A0AAD7D3S2_MYCRO|nr:hypothetical protein B0H17DRAFT_1081136 [Mycena rosella]